MYIYEGMSADVSGRRSETSETAADESPKWGRFLILRHATRGLAKQRVALLCHLTCIYIYIYSSTFYDTLH